MTRTDAQRVADVRRLLVAARAVVADCAALVGDLVRTTGLSREGVELALARHLELDATDAELSRLVSAAPEVERVHVILSANVFVGALRALALARAASDAVTVRPSRRDPAFARVLVAAAATDAVRLAEDASPMDVARGEIHVYGRDDTIARVRAAARPGVRVRGHGAGMGIAWICAEADPVDAANALASDVVPFDQRGCLSPRIALVCGDDARALAFARALHDALAAWSARVPRGALSADEAEQRARYASTMSFAGRVLAAPEHLVALAPAGAPLAVPPPGRHVHIAHVPDAASAVHLLAPLARFVVVVGAADPRDAAALAPPHARISPLGAMQRPPLDGPVDRRPD
jgi:hypothetical protein